MLQSAVMESQGVERRWRKEAEMKDGDDSDGEKREESSKQCYLEPPERGKGAARKCFLFKDIWSACRFLQCQQKLCLIQLYTV